MLLGWWNICDEDWWKKKGEFKTLPDREDYNKAQLLNMTGVFADFDVTNVSYNNVAVFTIARVINDMLGVNIFRYEDVFNDNSLCGISLTDEIYLKDGGIYNCIKYYTSMEAQNKLFNTGLISKYVSDIITISISEIYNTGIAYNDICIPDLSKYMPRITLIDSFKHHAFSDLDVPFDELYNVTISEFHELVNTFTSNYYSAINAVLGEAINYINQKVSEIKNQQELNSIMPSGPIDLVTRVNPEAAVQQPVQQAVPVQPVQQVNPAALSPEEEKAVQMMVNGMFFENMMQNAQQGVPVPQM